MQSKHTAQYHALQKYLEGRYANTVVLRISEIEDILGFALPGLARLQGEWWANLTSAQSDSWTSSQRTAVANLAAQTVTFTRAFA